MHEKLVIVPKKKNRFQKNVNYSMVYPCLPEFLLATFVNPFIFLIRESHLHWYGIFRHFVRI